MSGCSHRVLGRGAPDSLGSAPRPTAPHPVRTGEWWRVSPPSALCQHGARGGGPHAVGLRQPASHAALASAPACRVAPVTRSQSVSRSPAMRVRIPSSSWPSIHVPPVEGNQTIGIGGTATPPSESVPEHDVAPRDLHEVGSVQSKRDIDAGGRATSMRAELVRRGRSSLTR